MEYADEDFSLYLLHIDAATGTVLDDRTPSRTTGTTGILTAASSCRRCAA